MSPEATRKTREAIDSLTVIASYAALSSVAYYATTVLLLHVVRRDLSPGYRYLSEYAIGPYGTLMTSTFFALGAGSVAFSLGLVRSVSSKYRFLPGQLLWLTWACAVLLAGVYTSDLQGATHTPSGRVHDQMGMIAFSSAAIAIPLLSLPLRWEREWRHVWRNAMLLSLVIDVSFLTFDPLGRAGLGGLDQRVFLGALLIWMWILGSRMLTIARRDTPRLA
jgi:hypothetical protein